MSTSITIRLAHSFAILALLFTAPSWAGNVADLEGIVDTAFGENSTFGFDGAAVAIVQNGEIVLLKGYGVSDRESGTAVDVARTRLRLASVTKTITGLAIALLQEHGLIESIDDPVNKYLTRVRLPDKEGVAITIRHLLTHQAGFEETKQPFRELGHPYPATTGKYITAHIPAYIEPAGQHSNYSNFGTHMLGVMLEDITGKPYRDWVAKHIFRPLGMDWSLIEAPDRATPHLASMYRHFPNGEHYKLKNDWVQHELVSYAGSFQSTAADMARYMIGLLGGSVSLQIPAAAEPATLQEAFRPLAGNHPATAQFAHLFMVKYWNDIRIVEHQGYTLGARSTMTLVPELNLGVFIHVTGESAMGTPGDVLDSILGRGRLIAKDGVDYKATVTLSKLRELFLLPLLGPYSPAVDPNLEPHPLENYVGEYQSGRRAQEGLSVVLDLVRRSGQSMVEVGSDNDLVINGIRGYREIAGDVFFTRHSRGSQFGSNWEDLVAFSRDDQGNIAGFTNLYGETYNEKIGHYLSPARLSQLIYYVFVGGLFGVLLAFWPSRSTLQRQIKWTGTAYGALTLALPALFIGALAPFPDMAEKWLFSQSQDFLAFAVCCNIALLLGAVFLFLSVRYFIGNRQGWLRSMHIAVVAAGVVLTWIVAAQGNLIGINLP